MIPNEVIDIMKRKGSNLPRTTWGKRSFDNWEWPGTPRGNGLVPEESIPAWESLGKWHSTEAVFLFIYGPPGVGKTHIALALGWDRLIERGGLVQVLFYQVEALMDRIRGGFDSGDSNPLIEGLKGCDLLVLDDLGAQKLTEWSVAKLDSIIDHRYLEEKRTIITSNYPLSETERIPERIADRIRDGILLRLRGKSRRGPK